MVPARAFNSGVVNDAHRELAVHGSTFVTPVLRNSPVFRVTTASPREVAEAARKASGTWSSSGSPRRRLCSMIRAHARASSRDQSTIRSSNSRPGVVQGPVDDPVLEQFVEEIVESGGKVLPAPARGQTTDAVEDFPDGDGGEADAISFDGIQECGDSRLWAGPHHLRDDVRIDQPGKLGSHPPSSSANDSGL